MPLVQLYFSYGIENYYVIFFGSALQKCSLELSLFSLSMSSSRSKCFAAVVCCARKPLLGYQTGKPLLPWDHT